MPYLDTNLGSSLYPLLLKLIDVLIDLQDTYIKIHPKKVSKKPKALLITLDKLACKFTSKRRKSYY